MSKAAEIKVGQIWEVVDDNFYGSKNLNLKHIKRPARFHLKKGEKIEIRYEFKWNYRAEDDLYLTSDEQYILDKCKLFGKILPFVLEDNKASLDEIIRLKLYMKS